jgi:hypothetical protein
MNVLKAYLVPKQKKKDANKVDVVAPSVGMTVTTPEGSPLPIPIPTHLTSRPSSIFPAGDFRNGDTGSILDIKTDIMVNWLHQQQMERMWSLEMPGEGVILKKARDSFACSPARLRQETNGFYDNIVAINVRVSFNPNKCTLTLLMYRKCAMTVQTRMMKIFLSRQMPAMSRSKTASSFKYYHQSNICQGVRSISLPLSYETDKCSLSGTMNPGACWTGQPAFKNR